LVDAEPADYDGVLQALQWRCKLRRDRAGQSYAASGSAPKILMGRQRERAENSSARGNLLADQRTTALNAAVNKARAKVEVTTPLSIAIPSCGLPSNRHVLAFDEVSWRYDDRRLFQRLSFELRGPERVAVNGRNGAGKSTLLRLAAGQLRPQTGEIRRSVPLVLLDQTVSQLDRATSLVANMRRLNRDLDENAARAALARFAFRNVEADKLVRDLSGGECLRAGLACVLSAEPVPQLLLLDEPTNHLDLESIEVTERALSAYDGAILAVSHDPTFLEAIGVKRQIAL
jgi:ATPase subunit of ABC transporter with duplicated ATPase domains